RRGAIPPRQWWLVADRRQRVSRLWKAHGTRIPAGGGGDRHEAISRPPRFNIKVHDSMPSRSSLIPVAVLLLVSVVAIGAWSDRQSADEPSGAMVTLETYDIETGKPVT